MAIDFFGEVIGEGAELEVADAQLGGECEPRGDREAEVRHLRKAGALAPQDVAHRGGAVGAAIAERVDPPLQRRHRGSRRQRGQERRRVPRSLEILGDFGRVVP